MRLNFGILLLLLGGTVAVGAGFLAARLGALKGVEVREIDSPAFTLLYKTHTGAYHRLNESITEVESFAQANGIPCPQTFGEFLDDPLATEEVRLRSHGGCFLGEGAITLTQTLPEGFEVRTVPAHRYVEGTFSGSPAIGPWKVYPQLKGYLADHKLKTDGPNFEFYTILNPNEMTTRYLFPLAQVTPQ